MLTILWLCFLQHLDENSPLGDLLRGVLDVPACQIGELQFLSLDSSSVRLASSSSYLLIPLVSVCPCGSSCSWGGSQWLNPQRLLLHSGTLHAYPMPDTVD